jgi:1,4-alpha-glucan branching enzyme
MKDTDGDGRWRLAIPLPPGRFAYKFRIDGRTWVLDPSARDVVKNGFRGANSVGHL